MNVETFSASNIVTVTQAAAEHFASQVKKKNAKAIRLGLKEAGCTGYKYLIEEIDSPQSSDIAVTLENDLLMYIDADHVAEFQGIVIDYKKQGLNWTLELNNPNVKDACGCGESVNFQS